MDFARSEPGADPIVIEGYFAANPARVFRAWTDPNAVMKWFGPTPNSLHSASIDLRKGGAWRFVEAEVGGRSVGFEGEYLHIQTDTRLLFTWSKVIAHANGEREATPPSQVEVIFSAKGAGTDVRLVHSAVDSDAMRKGFRGGWTCAFGTMLELFTEH